MNLIAISYENIWPFENKKINIFFHEWKYLIKAPIWTWKSILFFDWPIYALYKFQNRNLLNMKAESGYIKLIFEQNNDYYLIIRNIKKGKTKDSCSSKLLKLDKNIEEILIKNENILEQSNIDIEELAEKYHIKSEEIEFKNEIDLQKTLESFLPPREVLLSTIVLLQDSENIFELVPSERLNILKIIFNLMSIDEGKEKIAEKKREIYYKLKTYSDTSIFDQKIKKVLEEYLNNYKSLEENHNELNNNKEISNIKNIKEKINITQFNHKNIPSDFIEPLNNKLNKIKQEYETLITNIENKKNNKQEINQKITEIKSRVNEKAERNNEINWKINNVDEENYKKVKTKKNNLLKEIENINKLINKENIIQGYKKLLNKENQEDRQENDITDIINNLIQEGKNMQHSIELINADIERQKIIYQNLINQKETKIKVEQEKQKNIEIQINKIKEKINNINTMIEQKSIFFCEAIKWDCPFIKKINKKNFDDLEQQKETMKKEINELNWENKKIENNIKELVNHKENNESSNKEKEQQKEKLKGFIAEIKSFLIQIKYKETKENITKINEIREQIEKLENEIIAHEIIIKEIDKFKQEIIENNTTIENLNNQLKNYEFEESKNTEIINQLEKEFNKINIQKVKKDKIILDNLIQNMNNLKTIEYDYKQLQNETKQLKEDEKIVNNLYNIFSKELLTYILSEYLPILTEIINNFLTQIVQYQIKIQVEEKNDVPQMQVKIIDEKWEREVKSLSWWQKIILKIVWMLSISSYLQTPMLFLDETINNLDYESIGKVSEVIENFVKQKKLKLYIVTHNEQIQNMNIRNNIISI